MSGAERRLRKIEDRLAVDAAGQADAEARQTAKASGLAYVDYLFDGGPLPEIDPVLKGRIDRCKGILDDLEEKQACLPGVLQR
jgi:hypothetical protein